MQDRIIKKWHPIIEKLDATYSLTEDEKISLCYYCEDYTLLNYKWFRTSGTNGMSPVKMEDVKMEDVKYVSDEYDTILPTLLKIYYNVIIELRKVNIPVTFSKESESEPTMNFDNGAVVVTSTSAFETKSSSIEIKDDLDEYLKGFGIDAMKKSEHALMEFTCGNLIELGKKNGSLCIHVTGNSLQIISEASLSKRMVLTYKVKNVQK
jgi:hypothetical protein